MNCSIIVKEILNRVVVEGTSAKVKRFQNGDYGEIYALVKFTEII